MKRVRTVLTTVAVLLAVFADVASVNAQVLNQQCFAVGDMAGQIASWRLHGKTKDQALSQSAKYYGGPQDRALLTTIVDSVYTGSAKPSPDSVSFQFTQYCAKQQH